MHDPHTPVDLEQVLDDIVELVAERNFDLYEATGDGSVRPL